MRLRDGAEITLRPVRPDDKPLFLAAFDRLSARSRYRRFLSPHTRLTSAELRYFTEVDHHDHEAIIALDAATGQAIGVARYIRDPQAPDSAEVAVTVVDDWQDRGVGTALMRELVRRAGEEGIAHASATVLGANAPVLRLMSDLGVARVTPRGAGTEDVVVDLAESRPA